MATILEFRPQSRASIAEASSRAAEIVLFPGVRYERWDDDDAPAMTKPRQRDVIKTGDDRD